MNEKKIKIKPSKTADTRTCDFMKVSRDELMESTLQHINDVRQGLDFFLDMMLRIREKHDYTKLQFFDVFYACFRTGFKRQDFLAQHYRKERHHFREKEYIKEDINLLDVLEQIADGVMAGMARSGKYVQEHIGADLLLKAYNNTVKLLIENIEIDGK